MSNIRDTEMDAVERTVLLSHCTGLCYHSVFLEDVYFSICATSVKQ